MMKQILEVSKCSTLDDYNNLISELMKIPETREYINTHNLYNGKILVNDCYVVKQSTHTTKVFLVA